MRILRWLTNWEKRCADIIAKDIVSMEPTIVTQRTNEMPENWQRLKLHNVMIDLETMSTEKTAAILSIGAVEFDVETQKLGAEFYQNITIASCMFMGMHRSAETLNWWARDENKAAREQLQEGAVTVELAVARFIQWCNGEIIPWSNPSTFDIVILQSAIRICNRKEPWNFWNEMCYRTVRNLHPDVYTARQGTKHNALDDAKHQARHLMAMLSKEPKEQNDDKSKYQRRASDSKG